VSCASDAPGEDNTLPPVQGRSGRGVASILPHLNHQQQTQIKAKPEDLESHAEGPTDEKD
jgi:hypothetical protein